MISHMRCGFDQILLICNLIGMFNFGSKLRVISMQENNKKTKENTQYDVCIAFSSFIHMSNKIKHDVYYNLV